MKRRTFLKTSAIAGAALSLGPIGRGTAFGQQAKSRVVIATDPQCFVNNATVATRVQDMVDHMVMSITGQSAKAAAYEALFPKPVTSSTKILIKYNESSGGYSLSMTAVQKALTSGLTSMLNGTFPSKNISAYGNNGQGAGSSFSVASTTYQIVSAIANCDYFINLAVCWAVGSNTAGVTLTLKNMMGALNGTLSAGIHSNFLSSSAPSLSIVNSQPMFKAKQVLAVIDAISICSHNGPFTPADGAAYSIIASKDMVAADYQGFLVLKNKGLTSDRIAVATTILNSAAIPSYGLGTNNPNNMDVVSISPPWNTTVVRSGAGAERLGLSSTVEKIDGGRRVVFKLQNGSSGPVELSMYAPNGGTIWSGNVLEWDGKTLAGLKVPPGDYMYCIRAGRDVVRGKVRWGL